MNWTCYIFGHKYTKINNAMESPYEGEHRFQGMKPESYHKLYVFCRRCHTSKLLHYFFYKDYIEIRK